METEDDEGRSSSRGCDLDCYDMTKKRVAFMMCVTEGRPGAEKDIQIMEKWLDAFRFQRPIEMCENPSGENLKEKLKKFQNEINQSREEISCCLITLMSHGMENGYILDKNGHKINLEEIVSLFNNKGCSKLWGKPKIFIIQACRGGQKDYGVQTDDKHKELNENIYGKLPTDSDYLIVYPCQKGSVALCDTETGSVMISTMDEVFLEHGMQWHVVDLFTKVNSKIVSKNFEVEQSEDTVKVTLVMESTLTKALYLAPN